ncbi:nuclear transport factor 2 family protein [Nocardia sp. BMG111209]|uniref:nuclear transport factor 2 family protein n=1 Tax=Nocardia sp. BMG111209 TaxID=1160137 RepID=UPI0003738E0F|nr:nuclear transport factor 2 family protein [Nocardia sp. BMG111209]
MTESASGVRELLDRAELTELVTRIGRCLDTQDFDGLARVYAPDAEFTMPGAVCTGVADIVDVARRGHEMFSATQHFVTPAAIEPDADRAAVLANVLMAGVPADGSQTRMFGSRYELTAVRGADGWRFVTHVITPVWDRRSP